MLHVRAVPAFELAISQAIFHSKCYEGGAMMNTVHPADRISEPAQKRKHAGQRSKKPHTAQQGVETE
jgi:hypothetical protein